MPRKQFEAARTNRTGAAAKFYLRFEDRIRKTTHYFGPIDSSDILSYYYDEYAKWLKSRGTLDSVALKDSQLSKIENLDLYSMTDWAELRNLDAPQVARR